MSLQLISRSADLTKLKDDGYEIEIVAGYLTVRNVPYVNQQRQVRRGSLVTALTMANDTTVRPGDHTILFAGEYPCDQHGRPLEQIRAGIQQTRIREGLVTEHRFSSKPLEGFYVDFHQKITTYIAILSAPAEAIDANATARTWRVIEADDPESVFRFVDTASSRAGITAVNRKLEMANVAIVGAGGTGSYVFDFVAKTPVKRIHLFDGDRFLQHSSFRAPGAPSGEQLKAIPYKVQYLAAIYSQWRRGVVPHDFYVDASNVDCLSGMDFVFLCIDGGGAKKSIVEKLEELGIPFVDVGMGVELTDDERLLGILRVTASTEEKRDHFRSRVALTGDGHENIYSRNIQIAELNAFNAALAVIKWKKHCGFYADFEKEHSTAYLIDGNTLINEDKL